MNITKSVTWLLLLIILPGYLLSLSAPEKSLTLLVDEPCDCLSTFNWVKTTFEANDAGFAYVLAAKGTKAYHLHNDSFLESIKGAENKSACATIIREWLSFFRKGHLGFYPTNITDASAPAVPEAGPAVEVSAFKEYLAAKDNLDMEGIWHSGTYTVALKNTAGTYHAVIVETTNNSWKPGEVKFSIHPNGSGVYYMGDHSARSFSKHQYYDGQALDVYGVFFKRVYPVVENVNPSIERYAALMEAYTPSISQPDADTYLFRIPSFDVGQKYLIDSLVRAYKAEITSTKNLIIDLRGNTGGANKSYYELLPLLYTGPIRTISWEHRSTELNNKRWYGWLESPDVSEEGKAFLRNVISKLEAGLNEFVYIYEEDEVEIFSQDQVYEYPATISILTDEYGASAVEQFLLSAQQSHKVKLYGRTTYGSLDISEMNQVPSPDGDYVLEYCITKSMRLPNDPIDGIGIRPDFYLDDAIPRYEWIDFVIKRTAKK